MLELDLSIGLPDWEDGQVHAERSLAVARAHRLPGLGTLLNKLSFKAHSQQRYTAATDHARAAVHEAERSGDLLQVGRAYLNLAQVSGAEGRHAQCQFFLDEARDRYAHLGSRSGLAEVCLLQANLSQELGDLPTAERAYREAEVRYRACGSPNHRYAAINLAILRCRDHRFGEARAQLESLDADLGPDGAPRLKAWVRLCLTTCLAHEGAWAALEAELPALRALLARRSFHDFGAITLGALCTELCLDAGQETAAQLAWALTHDQQRAMHQLDGHPELAARVAERWGRADGSAARGTHLVGERGAVDAHRLPGLEDPGVGHGLAVHLHPGEEPGALQQVAGPRPADPGRRPPAEAGRTGNGRARTHLHRPRPQPVAGAIRPHQRPAVAQRIQGGVALAQARRQGKGLFFDSARRDAVPGHLGELVQPVGVEVVFVEPREPVAADGALPTVGEHHRLGELGAVHQNGILARQRGEPGRAVGLGLQERLLPAHRHVGELQLGIGGPADAHLGRPDLEEADRLVGLTDEHEGHPRSSSKGTRAA